MYFCGSGSEAGADERGSGIRDSDRTVALWVTVFFTNLCQISQIEYFIFVQLFRFFE